MNLDLLPEVSKIRENSNSNEGLPDLRNNGLRHHAISGEPETMQDIHTALNEMNKRMHDLNSFLISVNRFYKTRMYLINSAAYVAATSPAQVDSANAYSNPQPTVVLDLNGKPIQSLYVENGSQVTQNIMDSFGNGNPIMSIGAGVWKILPIGELQNTLILPVVASSGLLRVVITEEVWKPDMGVVL